MCGKVFVPDKALFRSLFCSRSIARSRFLALALSLARGLFARTHVLSLSVSRSPLSHPILPSLSSPSLFLSLSTPFHLVQGCPCVSRGGRDDGRESQGEEKEEEETGGPGGENTRPRRESGGEIERWGGIDEWKGVQSSSWGYHRQVTVEMNTNVVAG